MAVRVPLPNRRQLQTLTGLVQAIKYHLNVASNTIITDDSALGYINACEDIDLTPLKSFFMKRSEQITVDENGKFKIRNLKYPMTELIGVFYQFSDQWQQNEWLQYVDPITFGKGYGTVYAQGLYTISTDTDGSNDQVIVTSPNPPSGSLYIEYYCDWAKLGDLTSSSRLQQISLTVSGQPVNNTVLSIQTINSNVAEPIANIPILFTSNARQISNAIANTSVTYQSNLPGNNITFFSTSQPTANTVLFTAPTFTSNNVQLSTVFTPQVGADISTVYVTAPFIQTVQTNWLLYNFPYLYYYGALKHAYNGLDDTERYQLVEKEYLKAVQVFQSFTDRAEFAGASQQPDYNQNVIW